MATENTGKKQVYKRWWFWALVLVGLAVLFGRGENGTPSSTPESIASAPSITLPEAQVRFVEIVSAAQSQSDSATNDMQRGGALATRETALCEALPSGTVTNWIGTIEDIDANSDGKGELEISIGQDITVSTYETLGIDTLLEPGSPVFSLVSSMEEGQRVVFSGGILPAVGELGAALGSESSDCFRETSISLAGNLRAPNFVFQFRDVAAYDPSSPLVDQGTAVPVPSAVSDAPPAPLQSSTDAMPVASSLDSCDLTEPLRPASSVGDSITVLLSPAEGAIDPENPDTSNNVFTTLENVERVGDNYLTGIVFGGSGHFPQFDGNWEEGRFIDSVTHYFPANEWGCE
jgi:hypothetical protein